MDRTSELIRERGGEYGSYADNSRRLATVVLALDLDRIAEQHPEKYYALLMVVVKACRLAYNPEHVDSWEDIRAYVTLALEGDGRP